MAVNDRLIFWATAILMAVTFNTPILGAQDTSVAPSPEDSKSAQIWKTSNVPSELIKSCDAPAFRPAKKPPDLVFDSLLAHKRYRLVVGPGFFGDNSPDNRDFVEPTAAMIDAALDARGFQPLPTPEMSSLTGDTQKHYLSGKAATEENIRSALILLSTLMNSDPNNHAIIYFVGHGAISPSHRDITFSVADRPVNDHDGLRFSDLVGLLTIRTYQTTSALSIPNYIIVLDTCFSGNAALGASAQVVEQYGVQSIQAVENVPYPQQIAILSSTQAGSNSEAFGLKDTNVSAFGYFFARSIQEDWNCTDSETRDGIITLTEIKDYVSPKLQQAKGMSYLAADMKPYLPPADDLKFMDYDPNRTAEDGFARHILAFNFAPQKGGNLAAVQLANGMVFTCATISGCTVPIASDMGQTFKVSATALTSSQLFKLNALTGGQAGSFPAETTLIEGLNLNSEEMYIAPALGRDVALKNLSAGKTKTSSGVILSIK